MEKIARVRVIAAPEDDEDEQGVMAGCEEDFRHLIRKRLHPDPFIKFVDDVQFIEWE